MTRPKLLLGLLLFLAVLGVFLRTLGNDFVQYDDPDYVVENGHVQSGLTWATFGWSFRSTAAFNWHPVTWLSHALDCQLFSMKPWGHHLTSVLLHALNSLLLFLVFERMTRAFWRSLAVAALFGLHPLHVESVAWVAERKDVLSAFFFLLTLAMYVRYVERRTQEKGEGRREKAAGGTERGAWSVEQGAGKEQKAESRKQKKERAAEGDAGAFSTLSYLPSSIFYVGSLLCFALGLMSKPMLVTLPFVLLLLDYWPLQRFQIENQKSKIKNLLVEKIAFLLLAAASCAVTFVVQNRSGAVRTMVSFPSGARLENALVSYDRYLGKLFWPTDLSVFYPHPGYWPAGMVVLSAVLLAAVSISVVVFRKPAPYLLTGWFWFAGTLMPVIGLVQVGEQAMADRYCYLPSIGIFMMLAWGAPSLIQSWSRRWLVLTVRRRRDGLQGRSAPLAVLGVAVLVGCAALSWKQIGYWQNGESLFRHALAVTDESSATGISPANAVIHLGLGYALLQSGGLSEAITQFEAALRCNPQSAKAHDDLGIALSRTGRVADAIPHFQAALRLSPKDAKAHSNLGMALQAQGRLSEAVGELEHAVSLNPNNAEARNNLAMALGRSGRLDEAIGQLQQSLVLNPNNAPARNNLGIALARRGRLDEAMAQFDLALILRPDSPETRVSLAKVLFGKGRRDEAVRQLNEALRLRPDYPEAQRQLRELTQ
jgi:protein O-mannosyl-transferase